jgi:hypothetical protein
MIYLIVLFCSIIDIYAVTFTEDDSPIRNVVKVKNVPNGAPFEKKDFVVCLKEVYLPFDDKSVQLAEWLELLRLLGASEVVVYATGDFQHPNVTKVLRYYYDSVLCSLLTRRFWLIAVDELYHVT